MYFRTRCTELHLELVKGSLSGLTANGKGLAVHWGRVPCVSEYDAKGAKTLLYDELG